MIKRNGENKIQFDIIGLLNLVIYVAVILVSVFLAVNTSIAELEIDTAIIKNDIEVIKNDIKMLKLDNRKIDMRCQDLDKRITKLEP